MTLRFGSLWAALAIAVLLTCGCATAPRSAGPAAQPADVWNGRLALRVESEQVQSFSAAFELKGNARAGELALYSPFGATIARLSWSPGVALLRSDGKEQAFDSLDALTRQATGAELPITSIFLWLAGEDASAQGWTADLRRLAQGRLEARRSVPAPAMELRLVLD